MSSKKSILLVYPKPQFDKNPRFGFSIQLMQLATILKQKYKVFFLDYSYLDFDESKFRLYLLNNNISHIVVEFDSFSLKRSENYENALLLLNIARERKIISVAFGNDCIMDNSNSICADYIIREDPLLKIGKIFNVFSDELTEMEYDVIPFPDRELLKTNPFFLKNSNSTLIRTSEGCLNTCSFCQRRGWQKKYKAHNIEYVIREFEYLKDHNYQNVWVADDNFTFDLSRAKKILSILSQQKLTVGMNLAISSWTRIDEDLLQLAQQANVKIISMGIESANYEILDFYNKKIDLQRTKQLIEYADLLGIYTIGNFIIGAPMETMVTIENTFDYIMSTKLDQINIKTLDYMLGSVLYENLPKKVEHHYFACSENGLCSFSLNELSKIKKDFLTRFNLERQDFRMEKIKKFGLPYIPLKI